MDEIVGVHPFVALENEFATMVGTMILELVGGTIRKKAEQWLCWPQRGCGLSSAEKRVQDAVCEDLRVDYFNYCRMVNETQHFGNFWQQVNERSCFILTATRQLVAICEAANWNISSHAEASDSSERSSRAS